MAASMAACTAAVDGAVGALPLPTRAPRSRSTVRAPASPTPSVLGGRAMGGSRSVGATTGRCSCNRGRRTRASTGAPARFPLPTGSITAVDVPPEPLSVSCWPDGMLVTASQAIAEPVAVI